MILNKVDHKKKQDNSLENLVNYAEIEEILDLDAMNLKIEQKKLQEQKA